MPNIRAVNQTGLTLITGGNGFVGSGVIARLATEGVETFACVRRDIVSMPKGVRIVPVAELTANTDWQASKVLFISPLASTSCATTVPTR